MGVYIDRPKSHLFPIPSRTHAMSTPYLLPPDEPQLTGACAFDGGICVWNGASAHVWTDADSWSRLASAPTDIDSGFTLQSGVLAGAATHVGFLPSGHSDWAWWIDLSSFSDAHPMYGDLLLCTDGETERYTLFAISEDGLDPLSTFGADELADPVAGWSPPTDTDRLLLLGDGGLWALDPPYGPAELQHLVSFDDIDLPARRTIPGPFQPGDATVVVPRHSRTALRLDLSDGTGHATGLAHLPGGAALWNAYLDDDPSMASDLLALLAALPGPAADGDLRLLDVFVDDDVVRAVATTAGILLPPRRPSRDGAAPPVQTLLTSPLDEAALTTWALWLQWDGAAEMACRRLCNDSNPTEALAESLRIFQAADAGHTLFDLVASEDPPPGPAGAYGYPAAQVRALVAPFGDDLRERVSSALTSPSVPMRVAACAAAGATPEDLPRSADASTSGAVLWSDEAAIPTDDLLANARHDHPTVRAVAQEACERLSLEVPSAQQTPS